jgi:predicted chitinase
MTDTNTNTNKLENWAFPFKTAGASAEVSDPQLYYDALAKANSGFYPMGANGLWHGGVHFDAGTGALLDQSAVRCIADGEVIAYRIDERYPTSQYGEGPTAVHLPFSTGFVLVKHRLELPALPTAPTPASAATTLTPATTTPATATPLATPAAEALTFYSLYMHLLDWNGYGLPGAPTPAEFLAPSLYTVSTRPSDPQLGLRVREDGPGSDILALLPKGCKVTLGESYPHKTHWKQLLSVDQGDAIPALASDVIGWVYAPELTGDSVADRAKDDEPAITLSHQGLRVRKEGKLNGTIIRVLPRGAQLKVGPKEASGYCKVLEVLDYKGVPALPNGPDGKLLGYVYHADLDASRTPPTFDTVTPLPTPIRIKAGELIGHLGQYQNHDDATPKTMLHLEVFSCDDVPAFITKSQARAASLPESEKTLLHVQPGTKLVTHTASMTAANPPTVRDPGNTIGVTRSIPLAVLNSLPAANKIQTSTPMLGGAPVVTQWWRLDNAFADENGNLISGWLADVISTRENPTGTRHSPWEWLNFDFIRETSTPADQFACRLDTQGQLSETELPNYQMHISTADGGPIADRLYKIIDGAGGSSCDGKLSTPEIRTALSKPWHAQSISQLISQYESEWYWQDAKWDALDPLMEHTPATPNTDWVAEKARIKTLAWWDKVEGQHGITAGGMAWHFQPVGIVSNLKDQKENLITLNMLKAVNPNGSNGHHENILPYLNKYANVYGISEKKAVTHFLSQIAHESGLRIISEGLNYSAIQMRRTYGCKIRNGQNQYNAATNDCNFGRLRDKLWTNEAQYANNPENLANYVYADRMDNGDESSGDGFKYRGRGMIQITGRGEYQNFQRIHNQKNPNDTQNFLDNPDLLINSIEYGVESAFVYWFTKRRSDGARLSAIAESGTVSEVTQVVNGGQNGYTDRKKRFNALALLMEIPQEV